MHVIDVKSGKKPTLSSVDKQYRKNDKWPSLRPNHVMHAITSRSTAFEEVTKYGGILLERTLFVHVILQLNIYRLYFHATFACMVKVIGSYLHYLQLHWKVNRSQGKCSVQEFPSNDPLLIHLTLA